MFTNKDQTLSNKTSIAILLQISVIDSLILDTIIVYRNWIIREWKIMSIDNNSILEYADATNFLNKFITLNNVLTKSVNIHYKKPENIEIMNTNEFIHNGCIVNSSYAPNAQYKPLIKLYYPSHEKAVCSLPGCNIKYYQFPFVQQMFTQFHVFTFVHTF